VEPSPAERVFPRNKRGIRLGRNPMEKTLLLCLIVSTILLLANLSPAVRPIGYDR
jgi:hypothetical protein